MKEPITHKTFPIPPKIALPEYPSDEIREKLVIAIMNEAFSRSHQRIDAGLATLGEDAVNRVDKAATEADMEIPDFLRQSFRRIMGAYIGCRTELLHVREEDTGRNVTSGIISNELTELAELIGPNMAEQIYRTLTSSVDAVLAERFGPRKSK